MKLAVRYVVAVLLAMVALQASAQTITVAGTGAAFTATANWQGVYSRTTATSSGKINVGFDIILSAMSVTLKNVTQSSGTQNYGGGQNWGLGAGRTGFTLTGPDGRTVTLIPTGWMLGQCQYSSFSNVEVINNTSSTSLLGYPLYASAYGSGQYSTYLLCPDNARSKAVQSYTAFPWVSGGFNGTGNWQLNVQSVDDYSSTWDWANSTIYYEYYGAPHNVTVNSWNMNFQGVYAVAQASPLQLFSTSNVILGKTQTQCITVNNVGGFPLIISGVSNFFGATTDYKVTTQFPITIPVNGTAQVCVDFTPTSVDARVCQFQLNTSGVDASVSPVQSQNFIVSLLGTGVAPIMDAQFKNVLYRTQALCREGVIKYFKVHNAGNATMTISQFDVVGAPLGNGLYVKNFTDPNGKVTDGASEYKVVYPTALAAGAPYSIASGATDSIGIAFYPMKEGTRLALLVIRSNAVNINTASGYQSRDSLGYVLQGVGTTPHIDATVENFGQVNQGDSAQAKITIHNTGTGDLRISSQTMTEGDYKQFKIITPFPDYTAKPPQVIKPDSTRTLVVQFKPDSIGFLYTRLRLVTNCIDADSGKAFELQGISRPVARATFAPKELFKKDTASVGGAAITRSVTITNTGGTDLVIDNVDFSGNDAANYSVTSALPMTVSKTGTLSFAFKPVLGHTAASTATANVHSNNAGGGTDMVSLLGYACQRSSQASPESLFVNVVIDTSETRQDQVTLSNPGNCPVAISSIAITGIDANLYKLIPPLPTSLAPGGTATVTVEFKTDRVTLQTPIAALSVTTDSPLDPVITLPLLARGCYYKVLALPVANTPLFLNDQTPISGSHVQCIILQNTGCVPLQITGAAISGPDANEYLQVAPTYPAAPIPPGGIDSVCVTFSRQTAGTKQATLRISTNSGEIKDLIYPLGANGVREAGISVNQFELFQNYPNPFNPSTRITYDIAKRGLVKLEVLNALGEVVSVLENSVMDAGRFSTVFDATTLTSGTYFYRLTAGAFTQTRVMNLLK